MSVKVMSYVWDIPSFKGSDKLVMLCLADHADDQGICWPSIDTISRKSGVSATTVKSTLKKLESGNWIAKKNRFKTAETGRLVRANNQYQLNVYLLKKTADEQTDFEQTNFDHSKFEQTREPQGVGQNSTGGGSESGYKPSVDPSIEPSSKDLVPSELETAEPEDPVLFRIPLNRKNTYHSVTQSDVMQWSMDYPAVDVMQKLREIVIWNNNNPSKRKTTGGISNHIHRWLSKEQDKGYGQVRPYQSPDFHSGDTTWANGLELGDDHETYR
ncbi:helix-turn-helix domain-containing protein [Vibrio vulnificus]|uniref:helix-turn-helix domain-containing protein n=2 Tax=Vibrio navarrensis TaxID=29495 RepID=UPI0012AE37F4|nr:helix-turn-helix domain-containing protein [Vibrio navarrensis]EGQ8175198.1 helix-turn-helix domain-containing protein [Vibrio vulnificus]MCU8263028.1 helix-turn-helix domain-containing protein [Vibrio vulnificus]MCU8486122.1 helix-turn-helix domain-containing protein [Vibrio vulnificus]